MQYIKDLINFCISILNISINLFGFEISLLNVFVYGLALSLVSWLIFGIFK